MRTFSGKRSALALAIAGVTAMSGTVVAPEAKSSRFREDSTLTGGIYYWQRERDRKDVTEDKYKTNLSLTRTPTRFPVGICRRYVRDRYCRVHRN